jgi:hypothetical protein
MSVGARDYIDQMLVKRYAKEKVNNPEDAAKMVISSDRYWEIQRDVAQVQMTLVKMSNFVNKVNKTLVGGNAKPAQAPA